MKKLLIILNWLIKTIFSSWFSAKAEQKEQAELKKQINNLEAELRDILHAQKTLYKTWLEGNIDTDTHDSQYAVNDDRRVQIKRELGVLYTRLKTSLHPETR